MPRKPRPEDQKWCIDPETGEPRIDKGAKNLCLDRSTICFIDGFHSKLYYRGYSIQDLAEHSSFEEVAYLLWYGDLPTRKQLENFKGYLREERDVPEPVVDLLRRIPRDVHPMEVLRTAVSYLGNYDPGRHDLSWDGVFRKALRLTAKMPTIVAYYHRIRSGLDLVPPDYTLSHAGNFLYMLHGEKPPAHWERAMDVSLILYAEHEMNASAFATVVIASTLSDYYSAIVGGIGALRGPLHGAANEMAIRQFMEIGSPDKVDEWYEKYILTKERRVMGAGHRVYKSYDPRAAIFREYARRFAEEKGGEVKRLYDIAYRLEERVMKKLCETRGICTNVDYWSGIVYYAMGIPIDLYTPIFAIARVAGWTAHMLEYTADNKIVRPRLYYDGELDKEYIPLEKRPE
jgi:citrate synthase